MIPASRWRRVAAATVLVADALLVVRALPSGPDTVLAVAVVLLAATAWALWRPGGWGGHVLVVAQVGSAVGGRAAPELAGDWVLAAVAAAAVVVTHLVLALLAAWPPGAALPTSTARRYAGQAGTLVGLGAAAAAVSLVAAGTPPGWDLVLGAVAILALALVTAQLTVLIRRGS